MDMAGVLWSKAGLCAPVLVPHDNRGVLAGFVASYLEIKIKVCN